MNYIKEINAFYDWMQINELSASEVNLWFALMHINNKAGWVETFTVAESVLCIKTKLSGRTIQNARNKLKQKGRIDFKSRKGGKAPIYRIIPFEKAMAKPTGNNAEDFTEQKTWTEINAEGCAEELSEGVSEGTSTLYKSNKTKVKKEIYKEAFKKVVNIFENSHMGTLDSNITQILIKISEKYSLDLIEEAFKIARNNKVNSIRYVEKILINWDKKDIKSTNQIKIYQKNKKGDEYVYGDDLYAEVKKLRLGRR